MKLLFHAVVLALAIAAPTAFADGDPDEISDAAPAPLEIGEASDFFDETFNDLPSELELVTEEGKRGLLIMFEMDECPFCARMKRTVLNRSDVQAYFRSNFRIISINTEGDLELIDFDGNTTTEKDFALKAFRVRATPVFLFLDSNGKLLKRGRLTGATKNAEEFLLLGRYIVEGHNEQLSFSRYKRKAASTAADGS